MDKQRLSELLTEASQQASRFPKWEDQYALSIHNAYLRDGEVVPAHELSNLLSITAAEHHKLQEAGQEKAENWANWYAEFMLTYLQTPETERSYSQFENHV